MIYVSLGCGNSLPSPDYIGIDIRKFKAVDYICDVSKDRLPFDDDSVDCVYASHLFEHLTPEGLFHCMEECWRVLLPRGFLYVEVPKAGTTAYLIHPDHKIQFIEDTFGFFQVPADGIDRHGYLKHFWHVCVQRPYDEFVVKTELFPNKKFGRFEYQECILLENQ